MNKIWHLTKVQLLSFFGINKALHNKDKNARPKLVGMSALMLFLGLYFVAISFLYSYQLAISFETMDMLDMLPAIMMAMTCVIILITTVYKVNGILFGFKDYDMVMSLPVKTSWIVASRVLLLYIMDIFFALIVLVPAGIVYAMRANPAPIYYFNFFVTLLFVPLVPIIIATLIGSLISMAASRFKHSNAISLIFTFAALIVLMAFSYSMNTSAGSMANISASIMEAVNRIYPLTDMYVNAVCRYDVVSLLLFIGISVLAFAFFTIVLGSRFKQINTGLTTNRTRGSYKMTEQTQSSQLKSLYQKELRRFFASSAYVVNTGFGVVLLTVMSVALLFFKSEQIEQLLKIPGLAQYIGKLTPLVVSMFIVLTCTTACSISLEGKSLWILKSSPVPVKTIFLSKIFVNLVLTLPAIALNSTLLIFSLRIGLVESILMYIFPASYAIFTAIMGLAVNLMLPNLEWTTEVTVIKQSVSVFVVTLVSLASAAIPFILVFSYPIFSPNAIAAFFAVVLLILSAGMYAFITTKGEKIFRAL